jgi:peptide/nickel transport system permease protein
MEAWGIDPAFIQSIRAAYGLDKSIPEQLLIYMWKALRLDLGYSFTYHQPVFEVILSKLGNTLILTCSAFSIALILGVLSGIKSAEKPYSKTDKINTVVSLFFWSMPGFWFGTMLLLFFSVYFNFFPVGGISAIGSQGIQRVLSILHHLVLPALTLGLGGYALYSRFMRASMLEVLRMDYIKTAWSKGCTPRMVYYKHAFRNSLLPLVTLVGMRLPALFMGSVLVETVFTWPGLGMLLYDSIKERDYNLIMAIFIIYSILMIVCNFIVDVVYSYLDPRIRYR